MTSDLPPTVLVLPSLLERDGFRFPQGSHPKIQLTCPPSITLHGHKSEIDYFWQSALIIKRKDVIQFS
jgi:hypothetical protein